MQIMQKGMLFILALLAVGCAGQGESPKPPQSAYDANPGPYIPPRQPDLIPYPDYATHSLAETLQADLEKTKVECAHPNDCPANVGMVLIYSRNYYQVQKGQCSATLVRPDVILTNSHCIPNETKKDRRLCGERIGFVLPMAQAGKKKFSRCKSILHFSDIDKSPAAPDYALIQLQDALTDSPTIIAREGVPANQLVTSYVVDPASEGYVSGVVRKKQCRTVQNSLFVSDYTHDYAYNVAMFAETCDLIGGNSGSGLLNDKGQLIGVISNGLNKDFNGTAFANLDAKKVNKPGRAANLACVDLSSIEIQQLPQCRDALKNAIDGFTRLSDPKMISNLLNDHILKIAKTLPEPFVYEISMPRAAENLYADRTRLGLVFLPHCLKPKNLWPAKLQSSANSQHKLSIRIQNVSLISNLNFDEFMRGSYSVSSEPSFITSVLMDTRGLSETANPATNLLLNIANASRAPSENLSINWCTAEELKEPFSYKGDR